MDADPTAARMEELLAHRAWVRRVARALVRDESSADDLEQETWLRASRAPAPRAPRAWLGTILRNTAVNMRLTERRRVAHESAAFPPRTVPSPDAIVQHAEAVERVARAVKTLAEPYRTAVFLRYFEDLAPPEIAARLSEPLETVRTRLRRGLAILRERLDAEHGGDRRAWCLLLLPIARGPRSTPVAPLSAASVAGVIAMTLTTKVLLGTAAVVALAVTLWWASPAETVPAVPAGLAHARESAAAELPKPPVARPRPRADAPEDIASTPAAAPAGDVAIGRVVDDVTGAPVGKASVRLGYGPLMDEKAPAAVTGDDGTFRIAGIGPNDLGRHKLLIVAPGYAEGLPAVYGWHLKRKPPEPTDLGEFRLERGARVAGHVLTADGTPVAGATVLFCRDTLTTAPPTFHPNESKESGTSDAEGRFALEHVPTAPGDWHHTLFAVTADGFGWAELPSVAGRKDIDVELRFAKVAEVAIAVRAGGAAVEGARVLAIPHFPPLGTKPEWPAVHELYVGRGELKAVFETKTDATGAARLSRLPMNGATCGYDVVVRADGFAPGLRDGLRLSPGDTKLVTIDLEPVRTVAVTGTVRAVDGTPIVGARVNFCGQQKVTTDATGAFRVENIDPSAYDLGGWIVVEADGFAQDQRQFRFSGPDGIARGLVRATYATPRSSQRAEETTPFDFVLGRAVKVVVRVVDEAGAPVQGAQVTLRRGQMGIETVSTGADGTARLDATPGPDRVIQVQAPEPNWEFLIPSDIPIPSEPADLAVVLRKVPSSARLVANLVDVATGEPLDPARADLHALDWRKQPRALSHSPSLESGRVVVDRVFAGDHVLWVETAGHAPARVPLHVDEGQKEATVTVRCQPPGTVRGVVEGLVEPRKRRMVFLDFPDVESCPDWVKLQSDPKLRNAAYLEEDGTFRIEGVPPGRLRIWTEFEGFRGETEVEVPGGAGVDTVIRLVALGRARFHAASVLPLPVAEVRFAGADGVWSRWSSFSGSEGKLPEWTANVPPGRVRWQARFRAAYTELPADAPAAVEGEFEATVGEVAEVPIDAR